MNKPIEYRINSRLYTTYQPAEQDLLLDKSKNYLFDLSYLGMLNLEGEKALEFLQGQVTCDVHKVSQIRMIQGLQCSLKGRILSQLDILNWQGLKLIAPKDMLASIKVSLNKPAMLSRVAINENTEYSILGFYLQNPEQSIPDNVSLPRDLYALTSTYDFCYYHLGNGFYIFIIPNEIKTDFCKHFQLVGSLTWHTLRIMQQQIDIYPEARDLFIPHRLGYQHSEFINFNKGCYKGQEIIARTHYKATIKHELRVFYIETTESVFSGQKLFNVTTGAEVGELVDYSIIDTNRYVVAASVLKQIDETVLLERQASTERFSVELAPWEKSLPLS